MALLGVPPGREWFTPERLSDPRSREALKKIRIVEDPEATKARERGTYLEISNRVDIAVRGTIFSESILIGDTLGSPNNPLTPEMLESKFRTLTIPSLGQETAETLLARLRDFEYVTDVNRIFDGV
jgi:2-methylcitrate dehydratase PrpD